MKSVLLYDRNMKSAKSICRIVGCGTLIPSPGYCTIHQKEYKDRFKDLPKAAGSREFYSSVRWTKASKSYRSRYPLCADHQSRGMVVKGDLVDHVVERGALEAKGLSPFSDAYLQTLCHSCHNKKLRLRGAKKK